MNVVLLKTFVKNGLSMYCDLKDFFLYNYMQLFSMHSVQYTIQLKICSQLSLVKQ